MRKVVRILGTSDTRTVRKFLIFPKILRVKGQKVFERRWLEYANIFQDTYLCRDGNYRWRDVVWAGENE